MASSSMTNGGLSLPRSNSVKAPPVSPLLDADDHQPTRASISTPSVSCTAATDTPAAETKHRKPSASYNAWSLRRLMDRVSRAFGKSRRRTKNKDAVNAGDTDSPVSMVMASNALSSFDDEQIDDVNGGSRLQVLPEKIIHEDEANMSADQPPAVETEQEQERVGTTDGDTTMAVNDEPLKTPTPEKETAVGEEGELMKGADPAPSPDPVVDVATDCEVKQAKEAAVEKREEEIAVAINDEPLKTPDTKTAVTDEELKNPAPVVDVAVDREIEEAAVKKHEEEIMSEVVRRFQGSRRVRTSTVDGEHLPRRRASNEVIEEARMKLLEMRQGSKVKALVGAFETVMDAPRTTASTPAAGKHSHHFIRTFTI